MGDYEDTMARAEKEALERGLVLNPDRARAEKVVKLLTDSFLEIGEYVCPCKQAHRPPVKGKETLCPCPEMMEEIAEHGHCHCRLFYKA
jgi:ferredoxin-thioredoxin reductase catalytic subunit